MTNRAKGLAETSKQFSSRLGPVLVRSLDVVLASLATKVWSTLRWFHKVSTVCVNLFSFYRLGKFALFVTPE